MITSQYPEVVTSDHQGFLTFAELRALVAEGMRRDVPDTAVVRVRAIPFRMADLGNRRGSIAQAVALDPRPAK